MTQIDQNRLVEFTQAIVRLKSLSGEESEVAQRVGDEMRALGFDEVETDAYGNVVGVIQGAHPGPTILLDAHTDTVGISPGVPWSVDPFGGEIHNGAIYGRGSADMKGALAAMVHGAAALDRAALHGRVVVSASTLEEVLEGVALRAVVERYPPDFVIIGESTHLNLARGGRGRAELHLTTTGVPSHSSAPHLGRNAVLDMMRVIAALEAMPLAEDPLVGPAILALTDIVSDPYPGNSVIPSICRVTYDRRLLPGERAASVLGAIRALPGLEDIKLDVVVDTAEYAAFTGNVLRAEKFFPAWVLEESHPFVQGALAALRGIGQSPSLGAYRFCTNAAYTAGIAGIPTIGYGPATEADAHRVDEHLKLAELIAVAEGYRAIIAEMLR